MCWCKRERVESNVLNNWKLNIFQIIDKCILNKKRNVTYFLPYISQGGHWSGKSQGNLIFLQGQGKVREFCKLVREILNTKKVREFHNFGPKYVL